MDVSDPLTYTTVIYNGTRWEKYGQNRRSISADGITWGYNSTLTGA